MMKKLLCVMLAVLMCLSVAGCKKEDSNNGNVSQRKGEEISAVDGYAEGRMGDIMKTYFFDYSVNSAYTCAEYNGYVPMSGYMMLVAEVTVKNTSRSSIPMFDTDFQVQWGSNDEDAWDVPITWYADPVSTEQLPGEYELAVNESKTGMLVFEVPTDSKDYSISYLELFSDDSEGDVFFVYFTATAK